MHPNCSKCGRGFKDSLAVEEVRHHRPDDFFSEHTFQHHRTSHPMSPCGPCGGRIIYDDLLPQHYTDSANHPKCSICLQGFRDDITLDEVRFCSFFPYCLLTSIASAIRASGCLVHRLRNPIQNCRRTIGPFLCSFLSSKMQRMSDRLQGRSGTGRSVH